jgi:EmrB/QacA subfamily drug resistance transporter
VTTRLDTPILTTGAVVMFGTLMPLLDIAMVNIALPSIQGALAEEDREVVAHARSSWVFVGYAMAMACAVPLSGWAGDRFGTRRPYLLALALFTGGSVLCALADSMPALTAMRIVQGAGGGLLLPLGMSILTRAAGPERLGRLVGAVGVPVLLGPIVGPLIGGWLVGIVGWRWIFLVNIPIGVLTCVIAAQRLPRDVPRRGARLDVIGLLLLSASLCLFLLGVSGLAAADGAAVAISLLSVVVGAALFVGFLAHVRQTPAPLLDPQLLYRRGAMAPVLTLCLFQLSFFGALVLIPAYLQQVRGETASATALLLVPQGIGALITVSIASLLTDRIPVGRFVPVGLALVAAGLAGLSQVDATGSYDAVIPLLFTMGLGMGATVVPTTICALRALRPEEVSRGSSMLTAVQQIASSAGVAGLSMLLTRALSGTPLDGVSQTSMDPADRVAAAEAFGDTFGLAAALVAVTVLVSFALPVRREVPHEK